VPSFSAVAPRIVATEGNKAMSPPGMLARAVKPEAIADAIALSVSDAATLGSEAVAPT
jgi:hypothetical protein